MRHLCINGRFLTQPITGVQRYGHEFLSALDAMLARGDPAVAGLKVTLVTPQTGVCHPINLQHIIHKPVGRFTGHAWEQLDLPRHVEGDLLFCPGNAAPLATLLSKMPVAVVVHDLSYRYFPDAYNWKFRALYGFVMPFVMWFSKCIITVSAAERAEILKVYPTVDDKIFAVPNGGMPQHVANDVAPVRRPKPYFLYVGSLTKRKNFPTVLRATADLLSELDFLLLVAGQGGNTFSFWANTSQEVPFAVEFLDQINNTAQLAALYKGAVCLVFPSRYESSGLPPIEAMACGCPVIVSDIPALRERCGDAALYCDADDVESIKQAMQALLLNGELRRDLSKKGMARATLFSWDDCVRKTLDRLRTY